MVSCLIACYLQPDWDTCKILENASKVFPVQIRKKGTWIAIRQRNEPEDWLNEAKRSSGCIGLMK